MLAIISGAEKFAFLFQPIYHGVGVFLYTGGKNDKLVPFTDFSKEFIAMRALVDVIEDGVLRADGAGPRDTDRGIELDLDHMTGGHPSATRKGVDKGFIKIED